MAPASQTAPGCADRAGPRGPSTVKAATRPVLQLTAQLHERARAAARRRSPGRPKPEPGHQPRNPLAVEVLAGHGHDAAIAPVEGRGQDPAVPQREDRRAARPHQLVVVLGPFDPPAQRHSERSRQRICGRGNRGGLRAARGGQGQGTPLHAVVLRPSAAFRRHPVDDLVGVHDVAGLAVHAVRGVDLQPLACRRRRRPSRRRSPDRSACRDCRTPRGSACGRCRCRGRSGVTADLRRDACRSSGRWSAGRTSAADRSWRG